MAAANYDLFIEQGATFRLSTVYGHTDGTLDGDGQPVVTPYDLTGCLVRMQLRLRPNAPVLLSATTSNGGIVIDPDPTTGKMTITLTDEATGSLSMTKAKYDVEVEYPSGDVLRILQGKVVISPSITQNANLADILPGVEPLLEVDDQDVTAAPTAV